MKNITNFTDYKLNEATVEIEETEEGVYVLTLDDIKNIVNTFVESGDVDEESILDELKDYKFVKVEDTEITSVDDGMTEIEEVDELSSDDEDPTFIKKFEES